MAELQADCNREMEANNAESAFAENGAIEEPEMPRSDTRACILQPSRHARGRPSQTMMELLGVTPGSVTIFGLINDVDHAVEVILDAGLLEHEVINAHPLSNDATTSIPREDLLRFIVATGHEPQILKIAGRSLM